MKGDVDSPIYRGHVDDTTGSTNLTWFNISSMARPLTFAIWNAERLGKGEVKDSAGGSALAMVMELVSLKADIQSSTWDPAEFSETGPMPWERTYPSGQQVPTSQCASKDPTSLCVGDVH